MNKIINLFYKPNPIDDLCKKINYSILNNIKELEVNVDNIDNETFLKLYNELRNTHLIDLNMKQSPVNNSEYLIMNFENYKGKQKIKISTKVEKIDLNNKRKINNPQSAIVINYQSNVLSFQDYKNKRRINEKA